MSGRLFLVPNTLDFGLAPDAPLADLRELLPMHTLRTAAGLGHWIAENARTTRAFLKRVDAVLPLARPLQQITIQELPRPRKGSATPAADPASDLLAPAFAGHDIGLISEAGLPAVADPGSGVVAAAHAAGLQVEPLPGASALLLALSASGLEGQSFAFVGYVPSDAAGRAARLRVLEQASRQWRQTQILIETPYRNQALLDALLAQLQPTTRLAVSCGLTMPGAFTRSDRVSGWRAARLDLPADVPAVFSFLAG